MAALLRVQQLRAGYGPIDALHDLSVEVNEGEIVALIGANGAGKTTTLMAVSGVVKARGGTVTFDGRDITRLPPHEVVKLGLAQSPEGRKIFPRLTVLENLQMGAFTRTDPAGVADDLEKAFQMFPILRERKGQAGGLLSGGQQQMLAIARALMARPKLLLLDEPSLGLAPQIVVQIFDVIRDLNRKGMSVLLVEQNARMALKVAHRGYVLETGRITFADRADVLLNDARVRAAYLGEQATRHRRVATLPPMKITRVETDLLRVPLPRPVSLPASQDPRAAKDVEVVLVHVRTDAKPAGLGLTYALGGGGAAIRAVIDELIVPILTGEDPAKTEWLFLRACAELEGVGFPGLAARAYAGVDFALWDLKGKVGGLPVYKLLGGYRTKVKAIAADTATPALGAKQAAKETRAVLDRGAAGVIVEVGTQDPDLDAERVRQIREAVPEGAWFEVSGCGRYDFSTALWLGRTFEEEFGIDGYLDPLRPDDSAGLTRLADRLDVPLAVGSLYDRPDDFVRLIDAGGVEAFRIDPVRLGGITPARKVSAAADLRHYATYPVRLPEVGVHLACGVVWGRVGEYVDWFETLFDGGPKFENGQLVAPDGPGLGLTVKESVVAKYRV